MCTCSDTNLRLVCFSWTYLQACLLKKKKLAALSHCQCAIFSPHSTNITQTAFLFMFSSSLFPSWLTYQLFWNVAPPSQSSVLMARGGPRLLRDSVGWWLTRKLATESTRLDHELSFAFKLLLYQSCYCMITKVHVRFMPSCCGKWKRMQKVH